MKPFYPVTLGFTLLCLGCGRANPHTAMTQVTSRSTAQRHALVRAHLVGSSGAPLDVAHVQVRGPDGNSILTRPILHGEIEIDLPDTTESITRLELSGVHHRPSTVIVVRDELPIGVWGTFPNSIEVTVKLGTYEPSASSDGKIGVVIYNDKNEMSDHTLSREPDGTLGATIDLKPGVHHYQVWGVADHVMVNGTSGSGYDLEKDGNYRSRLDVPSTPGKTHIVYDPKLAATPGSAHDVQFQSPTSRSAALTTLVRDVALVKEEADRIQWAQLGTTSPGAREGPWRRLHQRLSEIERSASDPLLRRAALIADFAEDAGDEPTKPPTPEQRAFARRAVEEISPTDPLWGLWHSFGNVLAAASDGVGRDVLARYESAFVENHPDTTAVAAFHLHQLSRQRAMGEQATSSELEEDKTRRRAAFQALQSPRFKDTFQRQVATRYDPDRPTAAGKPMLPFELPVLEKANAKSGATVSLKDFSGKFLLIDVWATWCKPCVAEVGALAKIHDQYGHGKKKRLEILSVSLDSTPEDVIAFRKNQPMPWHHAFAGLDEKKAALVTGGAAGVPFHILVDEAGKIIASGQELEMSVLPSTLARVLGPERP